MFLVWWQSPAPVKTSVSCELGLSPAGAGCLAPRLERVSSTTPRVLLTQAVHAARTLSEPCSYAGNTETPFFPFLFFPQGLLDSYAAPVGILLTVFGTSTN